VFSKSLPSLFQNSEIKTIIQNDEFEKMIRLCNSFSFSLYTAEEEYQAFINQSIPPNYSEYSFDSKQTVSFIPPPTG